MAKFLNTTATSYHLEELIKNAKERLILISPYLQPSDKIKELLEDKNRLKIDMRLVYRENKLQPGEINWLKGLNFLRTSVCKNLHAKCYLSEELCIITSLNLYQFSQDRNYEMGVLVERSLDGELYRETYEEAQRIIRISDEVRISIETVNKEPDSTEREEAGPGKLTTSKLAQKLGTKTADLLEKLIQTGHLELREGNNHLTAKGKKIGGEFRKSPKHGGYFLWPESFQL